MRKYGVPRGYKHRWKYSKGPWNEIKIAPGKWLFTWSSTKGRKIKAKYHRNAPKRGTLIKWRINAVQTAYKKDANHYITKMKGRKTLIKIRPGRKRFR